MSEQRRSERVLATLTAGVVIGMVEAVLALALAALVFGGYLKYFLADGIGLYLVAGALTLALVALLAGRRRVVGSVQDPAAAVLAIVVAAAAVNTFGGINRSFLTAVAVTLVVGILTGVAFLLLGSLELGNLIRFVPYPVVGGFLAGTGWLLLKGGIGVAAGTLVSLRDVGELVGSSELIRWVPALVFGLVLLLVTRFVRWRFALPATIVVGLVLFAIGMVVTGSSIDAAREGLWFLGPFTSPRLWQPWTFRALTGADWSAVLGQAAGIATAVFVAVIACLFNVSGVELLLGTDLDSNRELRDAGVVNVITAPFGGIPGYHALSLSSLANQMNVDARAAGLLAALVPLAAVVFGASIVELIPRMLVGGVLVFVGLSFLVEWIWDKRKALPIGEYLVVVAILVTIAAKGLLPGVEIGFVLAVVLFAVNYGRIELVHEVDLGRTYRSNVDRPPAERAVLQTLDERVQILRLNGFVFFGTANGLLERIRRRVEAGGLRFLLVDLRRVTGMDSSAVLSFRKVAQLAGAHGFELVFADASERVTAQLSRGQVVASEGVVAFEPDLDRGLERCEDGLLAEAPVGADDLAAAIDGSAEALAGMPEDLWPYLERLELAEGTRLIAQDEQPEDVFVLESGRLRIEVVTPEGTPLRLRTVRPGVVVGEIALYTGIPRTADVVADTPAVVLKLSRTAIERMQATDPQLASALHRWFAGMLAERLTDTLRAFETLRG